MRSVFLLLLIAVALSGCGYNPETPIYDTSRNPEHFPQAACELIDKVESGQIATLDQAGALFADLYTSHPELLDNTAWTGVITRLGARFAIRADDLLKDGPTAYTQVAEYYTLAAAARPDDQRSARRALLFSVWLDADRDSLLRVPLGGPANEAVIHARLELYRHFLCGDSISFEFARQFLGLRLIAGTREGDIAESILEQLSEADRCLLADLSGRPLGDVTAAAEFSDPALRLITYRVTDLNRTRRRIELYFEPEAHIERNLTVAVEMIGAATDSTAAPHLSFDFPTQPAAVDWPAKRVTTIGAEFDFDGRIETIRLGLYWRDGETIVHAKAANTDTHSVDLTVTER